MNYSIKTIPQFDKQLKRLVKKYPSFKGDFISFIESLRQIPEQGTPIGKNCYKIRIAINAKHKGKSGGARIITNIVISDATIYMLSTINQKRITLLIQNSMNY